MINDFEAAISAGREAWQRVSADSTWEDWLIIGQALEVGRKESMEAAGAPSPAGRNYNMQMGAWLTEHGFADMDKGIRSRLHDIMENLEAIKAWRATLPLTNRLQINFPNVVVRRWRASLPKPESKPAKRPGLRESVAALQAENDALRAEGRAANADAEGRAAKDAPFTRDDSARDIAAVLCRSFTTSKLDEIMRYVRAIRKDPKAAKGRSATAQRPNVQGALPPAESSIHVVRRNIQNVKTPIVKAPAGFARMAPAKSRHPPDPPPPSARKKH